jgi:hypothetical protein
VVSLSFDLGSGKSVVAGSERVTFTPDLRVCELVFRLWPNKPATAFAGNQLTVESVTVDGRAALSTPELAGGPDDAHPTLLEVSLPSCLAPGTPIDTALTFSLRLGEDTVERLGHDGEAMAWFGTAFPMLAWERGRGWMRDPAVDVPGEMAGSEEFRLAALEVVAPEGETVMGTGAAMGTSAGPHPGTTLHRFTAPSVRDVAVSVGQLEQVSRKVGPVRLHVAGPSRITGPLGVWADLTARSVRRLSALLGPVPYDDIWVTIVPSVPTGIEFPGAIQFGDYPPTRTGALISHEVAHMWFYGLVGDDQGRDPWLDEAFATYAQAVVDDDEQSYLDPPEPDIRGQLGRPMDYWAHQPDGAYARGVYGQGGRALLLARQAVGAAAFDAAIRAYVDRLAHQIADPSDVRDALAGLPAALRPLEAAGAFVNVQ